ncbi:uncharacterized protein LOC121254079 [Juglans microcarpa x Juglans regia]|uniref:uncharacterized protein LOC121254079 n=1 Tax=Juglans microcarpa x Juglans regia TaxID=2249226 RepID=UPI001B7DDFF8|nr:uncharacterized protein LOC121254079 [Juglans microcarpa x Juglans regia]
MQSFNETLRFIKRAKRNVLLNAKKPIPRGRPRLLSVLSLIHFRPLHHPDQANRARSPPSRTHTNSAVVVLKPPIAHEQRRRRAQAHRAVPSPSPSTSRSVAISILGRSYCEYFLWADIEIENEGKVACERERRLQKRKEELQKWEEELRKREEELRKREEELQRARVQMQKLKDDIQNDQDELHGVMKDINHTSIRPCVYWGLAILIFCCWIGSRTVTN